MTTPSCLALLKLRPAIHNMSDFSSVFRLLAKTSLGVEIQEFSATPLLPADIRADVIADAISTVQLHSNTLVTSAATKEAEHAEVMLELAAFEAREASRKGYKRAPRNIADVHWAGDGVGVRAMHELAAHRGGAQALTASCPWSTWRDWTRAATALHLGKTKLAHLDTRLATFNALVTLDISGCEVDTLCNLPSSLQCLQAYGCGVRKVEQAEPLPALLHAGLGFNSLQVLPGTTPAWLRCLREAAPGLQSLDVRSCPVLDLGQFLQAAASFAELKSLCVQGTPGWMATCAMEAAIRVLPGLRQLNGEDLAHVAREYNTVAYAAQQAWTAASVARAVEAAVAEAADAAGSASSRSKGSKAKSKAGSSKKGAKPAQPDAALLDSAAVAAARAHAEEACASQWRMVARQFEHQAALRMHVGAAGPLPSLAPLLDALDVADVDVLPFLEGETARAWLAAGSNAAAAATPSKGSKAGKAPKKKGAPAAADEPAMDEYQYVLQLEGRPEHSSADPVFTWRSAPASMCFDQEQIAQCYSMQDLPEGAGCVSWAPAVEPPAAPASKGKGASSKAADSSAASTPRVAAFTSQTVAVPLTCELVRTLQFDKFELQLLELRSVHAPQADSARPDSAAGDTLRRTPDTERVLARASIPLVAWLSSSQLSPLPVNALTVASQQADRAEDVDVEADSEAEAPADDLPSTGTRLFPVELSWRALPAPFMAALRASCKARVAADSQQAAGGAGKGKGGPKKSAAAAAAVGAAGAIQLPEEQAAEAASLARDRAKYVQRNCEPITVHIQAQLLRSVDIALAKHVLSEPSIAGSL